MPDRERLHWISPGGVSTDLTDWVNYFALRERMGFWSPAYTLRTYEVPGRAGAMVQNAKAAIRMVDLPIVIKDTSESNLRARVREIAKLLDSSVSDGRLRSVDVDGCSRDLYCRYISGLDRAIERPGSLETNLAFRATDPYWHGTSDLVFSLSGATDELGDSGEWFPFFPLVLVNRLVLGTATWNNPGDIEAWPTWEIRGPQDSIKIENETTGDELELADYVMETADRIYIDTRPGYKTIQDGDSVNLMGELTATSSFFSMDPGDNTITITMTGTTSDSLIRGIIRPRYNSA